MLFQDGADPHDARRVDPVGVDPAVSAFCRDGKRLDLHNKGAASFGHRRIGDTGRGHLAGTLADKE